jgi:DNA-binding MarR family transcriptional regulator
MSKAGTIPFETSHHVRDACLCLHVQRTARALARRFDDAFRPLDLTSGQFSLLVSLNRAAAPSIGSVASLLAMDRTTLTAALKPLERRGLVRVSIDNKDRRSRLLKLTPKGRALLSRAVPIWEKTHTALEKQLAGADPDRLRNDLHVLSGV